MAFPQIVSGWLIALALAGAPADRTEIVLHLLDYVAVDYREAVAHGPIVNDSEYREMQEFSARALEEIGKLVDHPDRDFLVEQGLRLTAQIEIREDANQVALTARRLRAAIIETYGVRTSPKHPPDLELGRLVYKENCAVCHGAEGRGDGRASKGLDPTPSDFHDAARTTGRSLYDLYATVTIGVEGTAMPSFALMDEQERWSVAAAVAEFGGTDVARGLQLARDLVRGSVAAYRDGRHDEAEKLALRAYLDGVESAEAALTILDATVVRKIEESMMGLRAGLRQDASVADIERQALLIDDALRRAGSLQHGQRFTWVAMFTSSFLILLREGLEAILVLAAVMAFVRKAGRYDVLPYVHAGWVAAVGLGLLTWGAANYAIEISGADREVTEGATALIAAAMMLYVGYWLHSKAHARAWARFIRGHVGAALAKRTLWAMTAIAFLAVYREMFEIVLFYQALWTQVTPATRSALVSGLIVSALALVSIAWFVLRYSVRLPVGLFFAVASFLLALLAIVFVGEGVAALQEAGVVSISPVAWLAVPRLGVFPSTQTLTAQAIAGLTVLASYYMAGRGARTVA